MAEDKGLKIIFDDEKEYDLDEIFENNLMNNSNGKILVHIIENCDNENCLNLENSSTERIYPGFDDYKKYLL